MVGGQCHSCGLYRCRLASYYSEIQAVSIVAGCRQIELPDELVRFGVGSLPDSMRRPLMGRALSALSQTALRSVCWSCLQSCTSRRLVLHPLDSHTPLRQNVYHPQDQSSVPFSLRGSNLIELEQILHIDLMLTAASGDPGRCRRGPRVFDHFGSEPCQWAQEPCAGRHALRGSAITDVMIELL